MSHCSGLTAISETCVTNRKGALPICEPSRGRAAHSLLRCVRMEAAPRPSPELLVDLPLEEPLDAPAVPRAEPPTLVSAAPPPVILTGTPPAAAGPPEAGSVRAAPRPASNDPQAGASTRVPIAKTAALSAAAAKLAAASTAHPQRPLGRAPSAVSPVAPAARPAPPPSTAARPAPPTAAAPPKPAPPVQAPRVAAPSLASWASARSAATSRPAAPAPVTPAPLRAVVPAPAPPVPVQPAAPATAAAAAPASMDRDFIARNQVIERYLSGRLPLKGATDFESFCHQHPELLDEIGLTDRVHAGVRLLEASGKPEPWQEAARPLWHRPQLIPGLTAAVLVLGAALAMVAVGSSAKSHRITALQKQAFERALDPATSTREIRLLPSRSGASNTPAITIGGGSTQLADFKIDESRSPYHSFRVTIDRIDQGRVAVITNLTKDSNGHLRMALNSSALGPGNYQLTIEGIGWRGDPEPDSWITIGITR